MRKLPLLFAGLVSLAISTAALGDDKVRIHMGLPVVLPPLLEVAPGVQVVQDFDKEIFFIDGWYWAQSDGSWYRSRNHRRTWLRVQASRLPPAIAKNEPGRYRRYQHDDKRSWPEARQARPSAKHWRTEDYQVRTPEAGKAPGGQGR